MRLLSDALLDSRAAFRMMWKSPSFASTAILSLSLGIAGATLIFSLLNAFLFRPSAGYMRPERLLTIYTYNPRTGGDGALTGWDIEEFRSGVPALESICAVTMARPALSHGGGARGGAERVTAIYTNGDLLQLLGYKPALGRQFTEEDHHATNGKVVFLSFDRWQRSFGARPDAIGASIFLNRVPHTVIGVLPSDFTLNAFVPASIDVVALLELNRTSDARPSRVMGIARVKDGASINQARTQIAALAQRRESHSAEARQGWRFGVQGLRDISLDGDGQVFFLLIGAAAFLVAIVCANVTNLQLSRVPERMREINVRFALGASRSRVIRQLITENLWLSLFGATLGVIFAIWAVSLIRKLIRGTNIGALDLAIDYRVLTFAVIASILSALIVGLWPAFRATRPPARTAERDRMKYALVFAQVACSIVLLTGTVLIANGLRRLWGTDPGFLTEGLYTTAAVLDDEKYEQQSRRAELGQALRAKLRSYPGIDSAGLSSFVPLNGGQSPRRPVQAQRGAHPSALHSAGVYAADPGYRAVMRTPLRSGRDFLDSDTAGSQPVAVVNESAARLMWPGRNPVGEQIAIDGVSRLVVGVTGDIRSFHLNSRPQPEVIVPLAQSPESVIHLLVRPSRADAGVAAAAAMRSISSLDPNLSLSPVRSMRQIIDHSMGGFRMFSTVIFALSAFAAALAAIGVTGVSMCLVQRRKRELGIRLALGAQPRQAVATVLRPLMIAVSGAMAVGVVGAGALGRLLSSSLHTLRPVESSMLPLGALGMLVIAVAACWIPARRVAKIDPAATLRAE
jgi:predicted permease